MLHRWERFRLIVSGFRIQFLPARERRLDEVTSFNKPPTSRLMNELAEIICSAFRAGGFWGALRPGAELTRH